MVDLNNNRSYGFIKKTQQDLKEIIASKGPFISEKDKLLVLDQIKRPHQADKYQDDQLVPQKLTDKNLKTLKEMIKSISQS